MKILDEFGGKFKGDSVKWIGLVLLALAVVFNLQSIFDWVQLAANTAGELIRLGLLLGTLFVSWAIVSSQAFQDMIAMFFNGVIRQFRNAFAEKNPLVVIAYYVDITMETLKQFKQDKARFAGFLNRLKGMLREETAKREKAEGIIREGRLAIQRTGSEQRINKLNNAIDLAAQDVEFAQMNETDLNQMIAVCESVLGKLDEWKDRAEYTQRKLENEERFLKRRWQITQIGRDIKKRMNTLFKQNPGLERDMQTATEAIRRGYAGVIGELVDFADNMKGVDVSFELTNAANRRKVMERLNLAGSTQAVAQLPEGGATEVAFSITETDSVKRK